MTKIHVLADETLGGIKREYVEVDRKAEVGEKIVIVDADAQSEAPFYDGDIFNVRELLDLSPGVRTTCDRLIFDREYHVLEPTDIVHIDGGRYQMVNRKAKIGEKVIYNGNIATVKSVSGGFAKVEEYEDAKGDVIGGFSHGLYRVLVPVETAEADEPQPADLIDVVAYLAKEVAELKKAAVHSKGQTRSLADIQEIEAKDLRKKIAKLQDEIDTLHKDNRTLGEELARVTKQVGEKTQSNVDALAEAFAALKRVGL